MKKSLLRPGASVSPKMPPGSQTSDFARSKILNLYCAGITNVLSLNFGKLSKSIKIYGPKKVFLVKMGILGYI